MAITSLILGVSFAAGPVGAEKPEMPGKKKDAAAAEGVPSALSPELSAFDADGNGKLNKKERQAANKAGVAVTADPKKKNGKKKNKKKKNPQMPPMTGPGE